MFIVTDDQTNLVKMKFFLNLILFCLHFLLQYSVATGVQHSKSFLINDQSSAINSFTVDPNFKYLYIPSANDIVQRDFDTGKVVRTLRGHKSEVHDLFLINNTMVSGSKDGTLIMWDLVSGSITKAVDSKCSLLALESYLVTKVFVSCSPPELARLIDLLSGAIVTQFGNSEFFYIYGDLIYGYFIGIAQDFVVYDKYFVKTVLNQGSASAMLRVGGFIYCASDRYFNIYSVNAITGVITTFEGTGHLNRVHGLALVNHYLLSGGIDGQLMLWDITTSSKIKVLTCNKGGSPEQILAFNETSVLLLLYDTVVLCDFVADMVLMSFEGLEISLQSLAIYDDMIFASSGYNGVKRWSITTQVQTAFTNNSASGMIFVASNCLIYCFDDDAIVMKDIDAEIIIKQVTDVNMHCNFQFYYDSGFVFIPFLDYRIDKYNLSSYSLVTQFFDPSFIHSSVRGMISVGTYFFSWYFQSIFVHWDASTGTQLKIYPSDARLVFMAWDTNLVYTLGPVVNILNPETYVSNELFYANFVPYCLFLDKSSGILFGAGDPPVIYGLDTSSNYQQVYKFVGHSSYITDILLNGKYIFSCSEDGTVKQWSLLTQRLVFSFEDKSQAITALVTIADFLLFGTVSSGIYEFELNSSFYKANFPNLGYKITDIFVADGLLFISSANLYISIWNASTLWVFSQFFGSSMANSLFTSKGLLYTGNADHTINSWNISRGAMVRSFVGHDAVINDIIIFDEFLFSAGGDSIICRWNIALAHVALKYVGHLGAVTSLLVYENSLFSSSLDKSIITWNVLSGVVLKTFVRNSYVLGHVGPINQIVICNDFIFSASSDLTIKQWDPATGSVFETLFGHFKPVTCLYCNHKSILSGSEDFSVLLWFPTFKEDFQSSTHSETTTLTKQIISLPQNQNHVAISLSIIIILVGISIVINCFAFYIYKVRNKPKNMTGPTSTTFLNPVKGLTDSSKPSSFNQQTTMFTQSLGIAIPGFLEMNVTSFRLVERIAKGGAGSIYLAEIFDKKEKVVAKVFKESYDSLSSLFKLAFDQEITLLEFLKSHRNIAKIVGFCRQPCCILMKFYHKGSFSKIIYSDNNISTIDFCRRLHDIASGLNFMHSKLIIHGDLKPDNVLIDIDENNEIFLVLTDFGIAQIISDKYLASESFKIANIRGLSVHYAAPEVFDRFRNNKNSAVIKTMAESGDIFSFGVIIYELVTRNPPWSLH